MLNHPSLKAVNSNFTRVRCDQITWKVLEETILLFDQWLGPNDFTNKGPIIFPTADLVDLIEDVWRNKLLDSITMTMQWNTEDNGFNWSTYYRKGQRDSK